MIMIHKSRSVWKYNHRMITVWNRVLQVVANIVGICIGMFYLIFFKSFERIQWYKFLTLSILVFILLAIIANVILFIWQKDILQFINLKLKNHKVTSELERKAQRKILDLPYTTLIINMINWFIGALVLSLYHLLFSDRDLRLIQTWVFGFIFFGGILLAGVVTCVIVYFSLEDSCRRLIPSFFPSGGVVDTPCSFRLMLKPRMLWIFLFSSVLPMVMMSILSYSKARMILDVDPEEVINKLFFLNCFMLLESLSLMLILSHLFAMSLVKPIREIQKAMLQVKNGDLTVAVPVFTNDELGSFAEHFNHMIEGLRDRAKIKENYDRQLKEYSFELERRVDDRTSDLKKSEEKYKGLYDSCKDGIVFLDLKRKIKDVNRSMADLTGYSVDELVNMSDTTFTSPKYLKIEDEIVREEIVKRGYSEPYEKEIIRKDGSIVPVTVRAWLIRDEELKPVGIWGFIRDISELKRAERLREDVERMARHDLKTPLNGVIGLSGRLKAQPNLTDEQRKWIKLVHESGRQILYMIEHSFDILRMEEHTYELNPIPCDLLAMFHKIIEDLKMIIDSKKVYIKLYKDDSNILFYAPNMPDIVINSDKDTDNNALKNSYYYVYGEFLLLQNMFSNLIKNAIEASPGLETVEIKIYRDTTYHNIEIHNMGAVPEEIRDRFFDKYATSGKKGGTGLGTYSALLIAITHKGNISYSTSDEKGTYIFVHLPISEKDEIRPEDTDVRNTPSPVRETPLENKPLCRILVAEDNVNNQMIFEMYFSELQYFYKIVENGKEAFDEFCTGQYDFIMMDIQMPVLDGLEAIKAIRQYESEHSLNPIKVAALTADTSMSMKNECIKAGFNGLIPKPVLSVEDLHKEIKSYI